MLAITYDSGALQDGLGAQLQRVMGIYAIASLFRIEYVHSNIKEVLVHKLDEIETLSDYKKYLFDINNFLEVTETQYRFDDFDPIYVNGLNSRILFRLMLKYRWSRKKVLLVVGNPNGVLDRFTGIWNYAPHARFSFNVHALNSATIVVHLRSGGTHDGHILNGEKTTRNLFSAYYIRAIELAIQQSKILDPMLIFVTDAAVSKVTFKPFSAAQAEMWDNSGYKFSKDKIAFEKNSAIEDVIRSFPRAKVIRGGNPLTTIGIMSGANQLIMSQSSLSMVAAILNRTGTVYYPKKFWHRPMKKWVILE
jgi:hypothetical protein